MELPKNIVQIGEMNPHCKIYIEDYAVSFLKQLNKESLDKNTAVALYGHMEKEGDRTVIFIYCAAKLDMLEREVRHLSQAQLQEIDRTGKRYFPEYEFVGYKMLNGEMVEGMHICEQGICRYMEGYAQFYEKNDIMLAYMLDYKGGVTSPEVVNREKYDVVRKRQEERRLINEAKKQDKKTDRRKNAKYKHKYAASNLKESEDYEALDGITDEGKNGIEPLTNVPGKVKEDSDTAVSDGISAGERQELSGVWNVWNKKKENSDTKTKSRALPVAAALLILCAWGMLNNGEGSSLNSLKEYVDGFVNNISDKNTGDNIPVSGKADTLTAEDKLVDAVKGENDITKAATEQAQQQTVQTAVNQNETANDINVKSEETNPEIYTEATPQINSDTNTVSETEQNANQTDITDTGAESDAGNDSQSPETESTQTAETKEAVSYTIKKGDTLLGISLKQYGNANQIKAICSMNGIDDPDDIKVGQKILLP